jgi:carboxypeptidase C (cathepsin A)
MYYSLFSAMGHNLGNNESSEGIPLIIWLQGGPGASSQFGAFTEIGPIRVEKGKAKLFHSTWNIFGHLLFIDQPLNVGFSYKSGDRNGKDQTSSAHQAADHLFNFLDNFYKTWPMLKKAPLYITGESFGGHYVPAFARKVIVNETWRALTKVQL